MIKTSWMPLRRVHPFAAAISAALTIAIAAAIPVQAPIATRS